MIGAAKLRMAIGNLAPPSIVGTPTMFTSDFPDCGGVFWTVGVDYVTSNPNNSTHKISIYLTDGTTLVADDVGFSGAWGDYTTTVQGDPFSSDFTSSMQFRVKLIKRSDSSVIQNVLSDIIYQDHSAPC